jgi:phosphoglycolate phosphatase-like HAD superfamily hydrolase
MCVCVCTCACGYISHTREHISHTREQVIDGVPEILEKLRAAGKKCFFVTNNSTKSRKVDL